MASSSALSFTGSFLSSASTFGSPISMANLGAFQILMVFTYRATAPTYVVALDKIDFKHFDTSSLTIPGLAFVQGTATGVIQTDISTFYWGQIYSAASVFNFHTYQLRVDACAARNHLGICTTCIKPTILIGNTSTNLCNFSTAIPNGWGMNLALGQASKCRDPNCLLCPSDHTVCISCDEKKGVRLVNTTCQSPVTMGVDQLKSANYSTPLVSSCGAVIVWLKNETSIALPPNLNNYFLNTEDPSFQAPNLTLRLTNSRGESSDFDKYTVKSLVQSEFLLLQLSCDSLAWDTYNLTISSNDAGSSYKIDAIMYSLSFQQKTFQLGQVGTVEPKDPSELVWIGTYGLSSIDQPTSTSLGFVWLGLDPTGTFFRFTKILQIVNKLYFININYGKRLEAFLAKCKISLQNTYNMNELVYNSANFRGKLDQAKVGVSLISVCRTMVIFYLMSWALQLMK